MKSFIILLAGIFLGSNLYAQQDSGDRTPVSDTSMFTVGKKSVEIIERNDSTFVKVIEENDDVISEFNFSDDDSDWDWPGMEDKDKYKFKGHWAGFEFGTNNYVDDRFSVTRTAENEFMDINTSRSWNLNLNFAQYSLPLNSQYIGFVTGLGIEWSNYHFSNHNTIVKNTQTQQIESEDINYDLSLNRFQTTYLTVPLILELQFFNAPRRERMYISTGIIGGIKLGSHTKVNYYNNGSKMKDKSRSDFYLRNVRYGVTGRVGFKLLKVYFNYYPTTLFLDDKGPELYPIAMGFCVTF